MKFCLFYRLKKYAGKRGINCVCWLITGIKTVQGEKI